VKGTISFYWMWWTVSAVVSHGWCGSAVGSGSYLNVWLPVWWLTGTGAYEECDDCHSRGNMGEAKGVESPNSLLVVYNW